jgi:signal transduction histidine kinase
MSIRTRMLLLFLALAVVPLLILGAVASSRSLRALEDMIAAQNARVAERVAATVEQRAALIQSDQLFLSENEEVQRWLATGDRDPAARAAAEQFLREAWARMSTTYVGLAYAGVGRTELFRLGSTDDLPTAELEPITHAITETRSGTPVGTLTLRARLPAVVPLEVLSTGLGQASVGMVIDRSTGKYVYLQAAAPSDTAPEPALATALGADSGTVRYRLRDTTRIASYHAIQSLPWTIVVSGAVNEFSAPFTRLGRSTLLLFLAVAGGVTLVFRQMLRRTTRSLEELTAATAVVGQGNFTPDLPPAGSDEVGRLTASFGTMVDKVRETVAEIQASRQMAVLGEFAAHLSHEVRNPLTSIKLNLQKLERDQREGRLPDSAAVPLGIALRESARLDDVVRGVLDLTRSGPPRRELGSLHAVISEALDVVASQAEASGVRIARQLEARSDRVVMDPSAVKGAILNLLLNAVEAMPSGGTLTVRTSSAGEAVTLAVRDTGPGIPEELRDRVFQPFFTRREGGTGLGLPLAKRAVEESGGTLALSPSMGPGAEFVITFPIGGVA